MLRDRLFISHANPEDNDFARWLALRLAAAGYPVWCDLTQLLGGEAFWKDVEAAIRSRAIKVLYVLSRASNHKAGPSKELQVAANVARDAKLTDFILPLLIDDLPPRDANILVADLNMMPFSPSWAAGLARLFTKLEKDGVPRDPAFSADAVADWWRTAFPSDATLLRAPDPCFSNRFRIRTFPPTLFVYQTSQSRTRRATQLDRPAHPITELGRSWLSFAPVEELWPRRNRRPALRPVRVATTTALASGVPAVGLDQATLRRGASRLLRTTWESWAQARGLAPYELSAKRVALYFRPEHDAKRRVSFIGCEGQKTWRQMVGAYRGHVYHFALSGRVLFEPAPALAVQTHVLFSDDGATLWTNPRSMARARRTACKDWWNADWRDRLSASMQFLADGHDSLRVPMSARTALEIETASLRFESPVTYMDDAVEVLATDADDDESEPNAEDA